MNELYLIFSNSLHSALMLSFNSETAWFAARAFGEQNMVLPTVAAFAGAMVAMGINFGMGYYLCKVKRLKFSEEAYNKVANVFQRYLVWILFFPQVPFLGIFAAFAGLFGASPLKTLGIIAAGRLCYYGYYLLHTT